MNSNYFVLGIIVLALVGGGIWLTRPGSFETDRPGMTGTPSVPSGAANPSTAQQPNGSMTDSVADRKIDAVSVAYTDKGFEPQTINIKAGTTVTFTNANESQKMWVASAPHPEHTNYPEFDQNKAVGKGESYQFTFNKVGTWKYHNHVDPSSFGSVVVE